MTGKLLDYADKYFSALSSVRLWIGVKVWVREKKFWVGWGERSPTGIDATIPYNNGLATESFKYQCFRQHGLQYPYGPYLWTWILIPPTAPPILDINVEEIREVIVDILM